MYKEPKVSFKVSESTTKPQSIAQASCDQLMGLTGFGMIANSKNMFWYPNSSPYQGGRSVQLH